MSDSFAQTLTIVTHANVSQTAFSQSEIRQIFSARKQFWDDGSKITVFVLDPNTAVHKQFCQQNLNMFPYQLERLWNQITFSGQGDPPLIKHSQDEIIEAVLSTPGAIGYAEESVLEKLRGTQRNNAE
ncbi:substrate-binding domain-containing protein [Alteromonas ponticola]|uniref:Substrate-binding domain-containing protein n=1 Tax=Alteromonas aquimaris TaxID=2998417 RepID=A0ABT3PAY9_9ALTE|nr:hypothetical protein [Alteromonas aquimaris]MCW8109944.1 substrate-binding domain-containing protein [Alteromonas aquimaris]